MKHYSMMALACAMALPLPAAAQDHSHIGMVMPDMDMPDMDRPDMDRPHGTSTDMAANHARHAPAPWAQGSGTSRLPGANPASHGFMTGAGEWELMVHGAISAQYTKATGPRGNEKAYSTSMLMAYATRETEWGRITARTMFSAEPTMQRAGYPNLFATGETAYGQPLVDRQHPHDLFMELAGRIDINVGASGSVFVYGGPVGEPALGPAAFMMRPSAKYNPEPPIAHHWMDSTHITFGVVTVGAGGPRWQIEASAFRGQEPDEARWNIEKPRLDSWSVRATITPSPRWALQASYGELKQPEKTHPGEDERRFTASTHYDNGTGLAAMAGFSAKRRVPGNTLTAWLAEVNWDLDRDNTLFGRLENVRNDEFFPDHAAPLHDIGFRVSKVQGGYARRMPVGPFNLALGGSLATFLMPSALKTDYGRRPVQFTVFAKLMLGG